MRAAVLTSPDATPADAEFPEPGPLPGREPLTLVAAGLHPAVRGIATGRHYGSTGAYPLVPGVDAVARTADGRLVYTGGARAPWGTFAERLATPFDADLPAGADPLAVAAGMNPAASGWIPLTEDPATTGTGTAVVLGASGAAGALAARSALALGHPRVIAVGRDRPAMRRLAQLGATTVPLAEGDAAAAALSDDLAAALDGTAPSVVLDYLWGPVAEAALAALARRGLDDDTADVRYLQIGSLAGEHAAVPASLLRSRRIRISGSGAGSVPVARFVAAVPSLLRRFADGALDLPYRTFPLSRVDEAWAYRGPERVVVVPG